MEYNIMYYNVQHTRTYDKFLISLTEKARALRKDRFLSDSGKWKTFPALGRKH